MKVKSLIFGGSGFIGQHLSDILDSNYLILDIVDGEKNYQYCDVTKPINVTSEQPAIIYNLAALCTIPKYEEKEYFETNILGAENICNFAREQNINTIVFISSIAPYGMREEERTEDSIPMPTNEYGISKLVSEHIHRTWQAEKRLERSLIILRPGIVFGKGEDGNFTRLYEAISNRIFFYPGRKNSKKASIYVKDLVRIMVEMANNSKPGVTLYNCCYPKPHSIEEICLTIGKVTGVRSPKIIIPAWLLISIAFTIFLSSKLLGKKMMGIHPDRVKKLMISTNIIGVKLHKEYPIKYDLYEAITDWFCDCEQKGLF